MHNRARGCDGLRHLPAAKSVKRFDLEVFAQRKDCLLGEKRVAVVAKRIRDFLELLLLLIGDEKLRRRNARKLVQQRLSILRLGQSELARAEIGIRETEGGPIGIDRAEIIGALRFEQVEIAYGARANDVGDVPRNAL